MKYIIDKYSSIVRKVHVRMTKLHNYISTTNIRNLTPRNPILSNETQNSSNFYFFQVNGDKKVRSQVRFGGYFGLSYYQLFQPKYDCLEREYLTHLLEVLTTIVRSANLVQCSLVGTNRESLERVPS